MNESFAFDKMTLDTLSFSLFHTMMMFLCPNVDGFFLTVCLGFLFVHMQRNFGYIYKLIHPIIYFFLSLSLCHDIT